MQNVWPTSLQVILVCRQKERFGFKVLVFNESSQVYFGLEKHSSENYKVKTLSSPLQARRAGVHPKIWMSCRWSNSLQEPEGFSGQEVMPGECFGVHNGPEPPPGSSRISAAEEGPSRLRELSGQMKIPVVTKSMCRMVVVASGLPPGPSGRLSPPPTPHPLLTSTWELVSADPT